MQSATISLSHDAAYGAASFVMRSISIQKTSVVEIRGCLHCKRPLSKMRRFFSGARFCSPVHRTAYQEELKAMMIARLIESGKRIRAAMKLDPLQQEVMAAKIGAAVMAWQALKVRAVE